MCDLRSEKLTGRCNLPAHDCVRSLHSISFARIAILDLVLGTILPYRRHLDHVSNCCDSALSWELCNQHEVLLHRNLSQKGSVVRRRLFAVLCRFHVHPEISPFSGIECVLGASSSGFSAKGLRCVKKMVCRPSSLCFPPAMSRFSRMDLMLKEQPM